MLTASCSLLVLGSCKDVSLGVDYMRWDGGADGGLRTSGCGVEPPASVATSMDFAGATRTFVLDVPAGYDKNQAYPAIFAYHGTGITASFFHDYLNIEAEVGSGAFVVTLDTGGTQGTWDTATDPLFFDALLAQLEGQYCMDEQRIFVAGHGTGALIASTLGCLRGNILRGIAPLSGANPPAGTCVGLTGVWITQGNNDPDWLAGGRSVRDFWVANNGCDGSQSLPVDPSPCVEYGGCAAGYPVRYCEYDGTIEPPPFAASGIWDFFQGLN